MAESGLGFEKHENVGKLEPPCNTEAEKLIRSVHPISGEPRNCIVCTNGNIHLMSVSGDLLRSLNCETTPRIALSLAFFHQTVDGFMHLARMAKCTFSVQKLANLSSLWKHATYAQPLYVTIRTKICSPQHHPLDTCGSGSDNCLQQLDMR